jgi:hypothetical protein
MFSLQHRSLYISFIFVFVQTMSLRSDAVSANKQDISNHLPVLATLILLDNDVSIDKTAFTGKKQRNIPQFTKWHGLSSVNALNALTKDSTHSQGASTTHTPRAVDNVAASHMKESTDTYKPEKTYKHSFGCGLIQGVDTTTIEFTVSIYSAKYSIPEYKNSIYTHSIGNKFGLKECSVHIVSQSVTTGITTSDNDVLTHPISDSIQSKTDVITRIYAPTDEVVHLTETLKDGPMHLFLGEELVKVYVSDVSIVRPQAVAKDETEVLNWSEFISV